MDDFTGRKYDGVVQQICARIHVCFVDVIRFNEY